MPENLYPQLPTAPPISQESFNIEMVRKYYQDIANLKEQYIVQRRKGGDYHLNGEFMGPTFSNSLFGVDFEFGC